MATSGQRGVLRLILGFVLLAIGVSILAGSGFALSRTESEQRAFALESGESLRIEGQNGKITFETWEGDEVVIEVTKEARAILKGLADWLNERVRIDWSHDDNGVQAVSRGTRGFIGGHVSVDFHILVPDGWSGTVSLRTSNGSITAVDLHGDVELRTSNGAITVREHSGTLRIHTSNGRIELSELDSVLVAETSNDKITLTDSILRGSGNIRTSNGAIDLTAELAGDARYEARTSNGRVTLGLVDPDVALELSTSNGSINLNTEVTTTQFDRTRLVGRIGSGTAHLEVRTSNGSISVSRL